MFFSAIDWNSSNSNIPSGFLCTKHCFEYIAYITSFNPHHTLYEIGAIFSLDCWCKWTWLKENQIKIQTENPDNPEVNIHFKRACISSSKRFTSEFFRILDFSYHISQTFRYSSTMKGRVSLFIPPSIY